MKCSKYFPEVPFKKSGPFGHKKYKNWCRLKPEKSGHIFGLPLNKSGCLESPLFVSAPPPFRGGTRFFFVGRGIEGENALREGGGN